MQQAARIPRRAARHPGCRGQAVLPDGDLLAGERVELPYTPVRPDEPADQVLAVLRGAETDILRGLPAFDPLADRDLTRRRVVPCARADLRLLLPSPDESCLLRLEAGLAGFAARDLVLDAPRSRSLAAFLRVRHSSPSVGLFFPEAWLWLGLPGLGGC